MQKSMDHEGHEAQEWNQAFCALTLRALRVLRGERDLGLLIGSGQLGVKFGWMLPRMHHEGHEGHEEWRR